MSSQPTPSPWSREAWQSSAAPNSPGASLPTATDWTGATLGAPTAPQTPVSAQIGASPTFTKPRTRGRLAGLVAIAVLAGGIGGGGSLLASTHLGQTPTATQTQVVQADASNPDWTAVAAAASEAVVAIQVVGADGSESLGAGVVIDAKGHVVTNNHVVAGAGSTITVTLGNTRYRANLVGADPTTDLAVLTLVDPPSDLKVLGYADSTTLRVGDPVMAIGNPLGLDDTVTTGIVSALHRPVTTRASSNSPVRQSSEVVVTSAIQTSAAINPGNSGGALVNTAGELVGITSSIATLSSGQSGNIGLGFAIGADQVKYVVDQLITKGYAEHPQIGVSATDSRGTGTLGAEVTNVAPGSPAAEAGLQAGDLITAVDGVPVASTESLVAQVRAGQVGKSMTLAVLRNGTSQDVTLTPVAAAR